MLKFREVMMIVLAGAIGGLVSVADAWTQPLVWPLTFAKFFALALLPAAKGGIAAGIGVYLFTTVNPTEFARSFFFALTCGLAFPAVLSNASTYADHITGHVAVNEVANNLETLAPQTSSSGRPAAQVDASVASDAADRVATAVAQVPPEQAPVVDQQISDVISRIASAPPETITPANVDAIARIGASASPSTLPQTQVEVRRALTELQEANVSPAVKARALRAQENL